MPSSGQPKMPVERSAPRRRQSPQGQLDSRALEIVSELVGKHNGHVDLDGERFANLQADMVEVKTSIRELSHDAKQAIDAQGVKQDAHHKSNTEALGALKSSLEDLSKKVAVDQGRGTGITSVGKFILTILPIMLSAMTLLFIMFGKHP